MDSNGDDFNFNSKSLNNSIQSAYMLIYERRVKSPLKVIVPKPLSDEKVISYKEEEIMKIKKQYNTLYHYDKDTYDSITQKLKETIFYDSSKNEYYAFRPFFNVERLIPKQYYFEILDDNSVLQKQQNISDEQFLIFFDSVISVLDNTLSTISSMKEETGNKIVSTFMNFIYNILSQKDKQKLLKTAKNKFIHILELSPGSLGSVFNYFTEHLKNVYDSLINENIHIVNVHSELLFDVIEKAYQANPSEFLKAISSNSSRNNFYDNVIKLIDFIINIFPRVPGRYFTKTGPVLNLINRLAFLDDILLKYLVDKEVVFIFITYLLGRDSPCYSDTLVKAGDNWDIARSNPQGYEPIIDLIYLIYRKSTDFVGNNQEALQISDRDRKCLRHPAFIKFIYKNSSKFFSEFLVNLSTNDQSFTIQSCIEIIKYIDDITYYDESDLYKLVLAILPVLGIEDQYQLSRFCMILGFPQLTVDEPNSRSNMPFFGFHIMNDINSKVWELRSSIVLKNYNTCLIKKLSFIKGREKVAIEIFLLLLEACITNSPLLKYIRNLNLEDNSSEDFINWGVNLINSYNNKHNNSVYLERLKELVEKLNVNLVSILQNKQILPGFEGFNGKSLNNLIKKEEFSLIYKSENVYIIKCEYTTNEIAFSKDLDFSKSRGSYEYYRSAPNNMTLDNESVSQISEENNILDMNDKIHNERELFKRIMPKLIQSGKITYLNTTTVKDAHSNVIRYVAFNSKLI